MQMTGKIWQDGKYWVVECPTLQANTQGVSRKDGLDMMKDWIRTMLDNPDYEFEIGMYGKNEFIMTFKDFLPIVGLMFQRCRSSAGLTFQDVADRLGKGNRSSVKSVESCKHVPRIDTLVEMFEAMGFDVQLSVAKKRA